MPKTAEDGERRQQQRRSPRTEEADAVKTRQSAAGEPTRSVEKEFVDGKPPSKGSDFEHTRLSPALVSGSVSCDGPPELRLKAAFAGSQSNASDCEQAVLLRESVGISPAVVSVPLESIGNRQLAAAVLECESEPPRSMSGETPLPAIDDGFSTLAHPGDVQTDGVSIECLCDDSESITRVDVVDAPSQAVLAVPHSAGPACMTDRVPRSEQLTDPIQQSLHHNSSEPRGTFPLTFSKEMRPMSCRRVPA
jgi:hypothetical protein